jgi:hypothetical protein
MPTLMTTLWDVNHSSPGERRSGYLFFSSLLVTKGCVPLDGPASGVGVDDGEALGNMDYWAEWGIRCGMSAGQGGKGS